MKLIITYEASDKTVGQHFGHCESFLYYDSEVGEPKLIDNGGYSHHELIGYLINLGIDVLICGSIGNHAIEMFKAHGIQVLPGASGLALDVLSSYLNGELKGDDAAIHQCSHNH